MIEIDGSSGEGGGQILRTSVALSAVTGEPVRVTNIRAGRPNPGLAPQHVTSIEAVAALADAAVDGLEPGSKEIVFRPGELLGGVYEFDVGTAGSVSLVLQSCLLPAALSRTDVEVVVRGGTDVKWSPPADYLAMAHAPVARMFGVRCSVDIVSRGFYPEGGGEVRMEVSPAGQLTCVSLERPGEVVDIRGVAYAQNLPEHVVTRMKHAALKQMIQFGDVKIVSDLRRGRSTGAGIVMVSRHENCVLGASALGERGIRSERLGEECASDLAETIASGATVDDHMMDQVLPYMAFAKGRSVAVVESMTGHARTNMDVIEEFLGEVFSTDETEAGLFRVAAH